MAVRTPRSSGRTQWCHVVWATSRRRELFKIPAAARFCERIIRERLAARNWTVDSLCLAGDRIHVLVRCPAGLPRKDVVRVLQRAAAQAVRRAGLAGAWDRRLWDGWAWCGVITNAHALRAIRRWILARRTARLGLSGWDWRWEVGVWDGGDGARERRGGLAHSLPRRWT